MNRVREYRRRLGLSLTELAERARIAPGDLSSLERGLRPAFPGWRRRIAAALGVPERVLFPPEERAGPSAKEA